MNAPATTMTSPRTDVANVRRAFIAWQCRVRQQLMREREGKPDDGIMPAVYLPKQDLPLGHIITLIHKSVLFSVLPEMQHMAHHTHDPATRRDKAVKFFQASYYQHADEFTDAITATFSPNSNGATALCAAKTCTLVYDAYAHRFTLPCRVEQVDGTHPLYENTWWHNHLFNPHLSADIIVLVFTPQWADATLQRP